MDSEQRADFEQELEDTSIKALLIQQNALLQAIHSELQTPITDDDAERVTCDLCGDEIQREGLREHAIESHKAPPDISMAALVRDT